MEEVNKSQLISEAELIEAINADTLVSISLGAGQPQKNVKLSTLATVVAALIPNATDKDRGILSAEKNRLLPRRLLRNKTTSVWCKICNIASYEGLYASVIFEIAGGNNYVYNPSLSYLSISNHNGTPYIKKHTLFSNSANDVSFGYVKNSNNSLDIFIKTGSYTVFVDIRLVNWGENTDLVKFYNEEYTTEPSGYNSIN